MVADGVAPGGGNAREGAAIAPVISSVGFAGQAAVPVLMSINPPDDAGVAASTFEPSATPGGVLAANTPGGVRAGASTGTFDRGDGAAGGERNGAEDGGIGSTRTGATPGPAVLRRLAERGPPGLPAVSRERFP